MRISCDYLLSLCGACSSPASCRMPLAVYSGISLHREIGILIPGFRGWVASAWFSPCEIVQPARFNALSMSLRFIFPSPLTLIIIRNHTCVNRGGYVSEIRSRSNYYIYLQGRGLPLLRETGRSDLLLHPARNRTRPWAGFPHGCVIVLDGRQPACVLCLALRKSRSKPKSAF